MLKQDARVALVAAALPLVGGLPAHASGDAPWVASPAGALGIDAGDMRPGGDVSALLAGSPLRVQSRASALRINGVALQWRALSSALAPAQVAAALGVAWRVVETPSGFGTGRAPAGAAAWIVLTRRSANELHALQLRAGWRGGTEGYWSVLDPTQAGGSRPRAPLSIPAGAGIESIIEQLDPGARSTQYLGRARQSSTALGQRLRRAALAAGWREQVPGAAGAGFQAFARGSELLELQVLAEGDAASFLLNVHGAAEGAR